MLFPQISLNSSQSLPLVLRNTGSITSHIKTLIVSSSDVFHVHSLESELEDDTDPSAPLVFSLEPGEERECQVHFTPEAVKKYRGELRLMVEDNVFERQQIILIGEGYQDSISITNIRGMADYKPLGEMEEVGDELERKNGSEIFYVLSVD